MIFIRISCNKGDTPWISEYSSMIGSKVGEKIVREIKDNSHIRKAVFLFNLNKQYIRRFDGGIKCEQINN